MIGEPQNFLKEFLPDFWVKRSHFIKENFPHLQFSAEEELNGEIPDWDAFAELYFQEAKEGYIEWFYER
jgi:hypothetical protein